MKTSREERDERDAVRDGKRISGRRKDRSPSPERERDKKSRDGSRERRERKREKREKRERNGVKVEGNDRFQESTRGDFEAQVGSSGFMQFPGQFDGGLVGVPPATSVPMSSHVPDQFPGQFPTTSAGPYRPPLAVKEGGPGLAADYYGDAGQSVTNQPGVRPQQPTLIIGAEPHLQPASSTAQPPPEPSASGGVGAAASFFSNTVETETFNNHTSHYSSSAKPGSSYTESNSRPESQYNSNSTSVFPTVGAAASYYIGSQSNSEEHRPQHTPSIVGSQTATSQRPLSHINGHYDATAQYAGPPTPGKHPSHSSIAPLYAAGAAGLAAAAYHQSHHSSQHSPNTQPFVSGSMAQKRRHRGPLSSFVEFFKDSEGVAQFEEYTEYIGVCRECFAPGSSPRDAPRKHHYRRRRSNDRHSSSMRIDKDSRYWSSDSEKRRKKNNSWLGAGIASYGLAKLGESFFNERNDLDDTYSVKPAHPKKSHASPDRKSSVSRGTIRRSSDVNSRHGSNSRDYVETGITSDGRIYKKEIHGGSSGKSRVTTYGAGRRSKSKSRSRSHSSDRKRFSAGVAVGSAIGSSVITPGSQHQSHSPEKVFSEAKYRSHEKSPVRNSKHRSRRSPEPRADTKILFNTRSAHHGKSHRKHKKRNSPLSFSSSSSSSTSSSSSDGGSVSNGRSIRRRGSRRKKVEHDEHRRAELAVAGLGAAAAALALESTRQSNKSQKRGDLVAVKESKSRHRQRPESRKRSKHSPSNSEGDVWESASEGDADSINSDLAYGSTIQRKDSRASLSSDSSGTSKWGWRWGSPKKRADRVDRSRIPDSHGVPYAGVGTGAVFESAATGVGHDVDDQRPQITMHSNSSLPLQPAYSVPTSSSSRHSVDRNRPSLPTDYSIVSNRPEPVPIQHPQPITPVSPAVYTTQAPSGDPYSVSTGSASAQVAYGQHTTLDVRSEEAYNIAAQSVNSYNPSTPSAHTAFAVPAKTKVHRRDSSPTRYDPQSVATTSLPPRRASLRENTATVRFDLPEENNGRERRAGRSQTREDEDRQMRHERHEIEEREHAQSETTGAKNESRRYSESQIPRVENLDDAETTDESPIVGVKSGKSISWAVPAAIGAATAVGAAVKAGKPRADSPEEDSRERMRRARPTREISPEHIHQNYEDFEREELEERAGAKGKSKSVPQEISKPKRTSSHEDYADFFTPTELLSKSPIYKEATAEADADSAITAFEIPQVITIEPSGFRDSREAPAYSFGPNGEELNPDPLAPPWVPKLKLISPTPQPSSPDGSEAGDVSPFIKSQAAIEEFSEAPSDPQPTAQDVFEEFQTPKYTIIEPKSVREPDDDFVESVLVQPEISTAPELQESASPQSEDTPRKSAEDFGDDLEFAGTLAAGLAEAGFDPSIVVDDPGFRRRQSPPGSDDLGGYRPSFPEDFVDVRKEVPKSDRIPAQQGFVEGEISPHMPGSFEDDEPIEDVEDPEVKVNKRERRRKDKQATRQGTTESLDKDINRERNVEAVTEAEAIEKESTVLVREPDQYSSDDGRSATVTAPSFTEKSKGRKKKRSKRDSTAFDDENSVISSPTTRDEAQDVKTRSKSSKAGLFGLFGRSSADASEPKVAIKEKATTTTNGFEESRKKSKRKSKDRRAAQETEETTPLAADADGNPAKDSGRTTLPAEVRTPASTGRDPSPPTQNWLTNPEDEASILSKEAKPRESTLTDRTEESRSPNDVEPASFSEVHQRSPPPSDISVPEEPVPVDVGSGTKETFQVAAGQPTNVIRRSSSPLSTHQIHEPASGVSSLPSSPTSRYRGSSQRVSELHDADRTHSPQPSPTAIPFHFRVPPPSPSMARTSSSLPQTPLISEAAPAPSRPKLRPRSTEFKSSNEFRPLWLVSKHASIREKPFDEVYPSLPSSHTTSRSSSVHDPDESAYDRTLSLHEPDDDQSLVFGGQRILNDHTQDEMESDLLDSQQPTPTAASFPVAIREVMQAPEATNSNAENLEHHIPAAAGVRLEDLPSLPSSRTSSPVVDPVLKNWKASHDLKAITLGAVFGASAASAVAAIKHHQDGAKDLEVSAYQQSQDMIEKEDIRPYLAPAKVHDDSVGVDYDQLPIDREMDEATRNPESINASAVDEDLFTPELPPMTKTSKFGEVEPLNAEQQRMLQEQDAQDAVDSWFAPSSPKQFKKKTKRKGQTKATATETSDVHPSATTGTASDDSVYTKHDDSKESEPEQSTVREVANAVKLTQDPAATNAPSSIDLTADLSISEVVHRMSSAAEATKAEPSAITTINSEEHEDLVELQPQAESSGSRDSFSEMSKSFGDQIHEPSLETPFVDTDRPNTGPINEFMADLSHQGMSLPPGNGSSTPPNKDSNKQKSVISASIDNLLESAETSRTSSSSSKRAKKAKNKSKQGAEPEAELVSMLEPVGESNQVSTQDEAPAVESTNEYPQTVDLLGYTLPEFNSDAKPVPLKRSKKSKKARKHVQEDEHRDQDSPAQTRDAVREQSLPEGSIVNQEGLDQRPVHDSHHSEFGQKDIQSNQETSQVREQSMITASPRIYPEDVPLPDNEDLDLLDEILDRPYVHTNSQTKEFPVAESFLTRTPSSDPTSHEDFITIPSDTPNERERYKNPAEISPSKTKESDQMDAIVAGAVLDPADHSDSIASVQMPTFNAESETRLARSLEQQPSDAEAEVARTEMEPALPDEVELPNDETPQNDLGVAQNTQQMGPRASALDPITSLRIPEYGAFDTQHEQGSSHSVPYELNPHMKLPESPPPDSQKDNDDISHVIGRKDLLKEETSQSSKDQISIPRDTDSSNDAHASKASLREPHSADHAQAMSYVGEVDQQPSEQLQSDPSSRIHDSLPELDIVQEEKSIASMPERLPGYDEPLPSQPGLQSPTLTPKAQELMSSTLSAPLPHTPAMGDSSSRAVDGMDFTNDIQIPSLDPPSPDTQSKSLDQMPLIHSSANPNSIESNLEVSMSSTPMSTAQAVTDNLATTATKPIEKLVTASSESLYPESKPTGSPIEECIQQDTEWTAFTKKEKKKGMASKKDRNLQPQTGNAQKPTATEPLVAMTNTADEVKLLLDSENSQQGPSALALQSQSVDQTVVDKAPDYTLNDASINRASVKKAKKKAKAKDRELASVAASNSQEQLPNVFEGANDKALHEGDASVDISQPIDDTEVEDTLRGEIIVPIEQSREPPEKYDSISVEDSKPDPAATTPTTTELPTSQELIEAGNEALTLEAGTGLFNISNDDIKSKSPNVHDIGKTPRGLGDVQPGVSKTGDFLQAEPSFDASNKENDPRSYPITDEPIENLTELSLAASAATEVAEATNAVEEALKSKEASQDLSSMSKKDRKKAAKKKKNSSWEDDLVTADADSSGAQKAIEPMKESTDGAIMFSKKERKRSKKNQRLIRDDDAESLAGQDASILPSDNLPTMTSEVSGTIEEAPAKVDMDASNKAVETLNMSSRDEIILEDATLDAKEPSISKDEIGDIPLDAKKDNEMTWSQTEERVNDGSTSRSADEVNLDDERVTPEPISDSINSKESAPIGYLEDLPGERKKTKKTKKREKIKSSLREENSALQAEDKISNGSIAGNSSEALKKTFTIPTEESGEDTVTQRQNKKTKKAKKSRSLSWADDMEATPSQNDPAGANPDILNAASHDVQETLSTIEEASEDKPAREAGEQVYHRTHSNESERIDEAIIEAQDPSSENVTTVGQSENPIVRSTKKDKKEKKKAKKSKRFSWDDAETPDIQLERISDPDLTIEQLQVSEGSKSLNKPTSTGRPAEAQQGERLGYVSSMQNAFLGHENSVSVEERQQEAEVPEDVPGAGEVVDDEVTPIQTIDTEPDPYFTKKSKKNEKKKKKSTKQPKVLDLDEELAQAAPQVIEETVEDESPRDLSNLPQSKISDGVADQLNLQKGDEHEAPVLPREPIDQSTDLNEDDALSPSTVAREQLFKAPIAPEQYTNDTSTTATAPAQTAPEQAHKRSFFEEEGPDMGIGEETAIEPPSKTKRTDADPPSQKIMAMEEEVLAVPSKSKKKKKSKKGTAVGFGLEEPQQSDTLNEIDGAQRDRSTSADNESTEDARYGEHGWQPQSYLQPAGMTLEDALREPGLESQSLRPVNKADDGAIPRDLSVEKANTQEQFPFRSASEPTVVGVNDTKVDDMKTSSTATPRADVAFQSDTTGPVQAPANVNASRGLSDESNSPREGAQLSQAHEIYSSVSLPNTESKKKKQKQPSIGEDETNTSPIMDRGDEYIPPSAMPFPQPHRAMPEPGLQQVRPVELREPESVLPTIENAKQQDSSISRGDERSDYPSIPTENAEGAIIRDPNMPFLEPWGPANETTSPSVEEPPDTIQKLVGTERTTTSIKNISPDLRHAPVDTSTSTHEQESRDHREAVPETHGAQVFSVEGNEFPKREDIKILAGEDSIRIGNLALEHGDDVQSLDLAEDRESKEQTAEESTYNSVPRGEGDYSRADEPLGADDLTPLTKSRKTKKKSKKQAFAAETVDSRTLGEPADQETMPQRLESPKSRSRSSSPKQPQFSTPNTMQSNDKANTQASLAGLAGGLGAGAVVAANLDQRDFKQKGKNKKEKKRKAWDEVEAAVPEPTTSHPQMEIQGDQPLPSPPRKTMLTPPISPEAMPTTISRENIVDKENATVHNAPANRDSAIHVSDSPNPSYNLFAHRVGRDSGYQDTEASPIIGVGDTASQDRTGLEDVHLTGNAEKVQSFDHQSNQFAEGSAKNPLNISVEVNPAYEVKIQNPAFQRHHPSDVSRLDPDQRSFAEEGFGVLNDQPISLPVKENLSMPLPSSPSLGHDQRTFADNGIAIPRDVLPTHENDGHRQPSPISPSTKDRSSVLFQSSPSTREELADIQQHQGPSQQEDQVPEHALSPVRDDGRAIKDGVPHQSLFGGPIGTGSEIPSPPSSPIGNEASHRRVLDTIKEYSPEESPLQRKARTRSYSPSPERGSRRGRRTDTQPRAQSPQITKPETREASPTPDLIPEVPQPAMYEEQRSVDLERSRSRSAENRAPSRQSVVSPLGGLPKQREGDHRSFSGASIKSGDSINAIIRTPDQVRSASGLSYHSSTPPLRRVDRSVSGDLRAKSLAKQSEAEPQVFASSSSYDPTKDKGKDKMADVYVSKHDSEFNVIDAFDD